MGFDPRDKLGRIRLRLITALAVIALIPIVVVGTAAIPYQLAVEARLLGSASDGLEAVSRHGDLAQAASEERVRLTAFDEAESVARHGQIVMSRWTNHVALNFVDSETRRELAAFEQAQTSPPESGSGCRLALADKLLLCRAVGVDPAGRTVVSEAAAIRTVGTLWGHRATLMAVVCQMLFVALALGLWLGRRTVGPIHRLRNEVASRTQPPVSTEPVKVEGRDEVAELGHSFNELLGALEAQRNANMDFLAEVAHELKTPIATIQQFTDLARDLDDPRLEQPLELVEASCRRMQLRTGELMELARAAAGLPGQERELVDLATFVDNLVAARGGRIEVSTCPADVVVSLRYLEIALGNVIDNAVAHAKSRVWIEMRRQDGDVVVVVRDDGPGIADDDLDRVFERFHSQRDGGTGLGLGMTRAVMRAHGGDALARPAQGAVVELRLPVA